ncbi:MAG: class I SAM-dependent methyltransferase [Dermatophilaceae bacterium]
MPDERARFPRTGWRTVAVHTAVDELVVRRQRDLGRALRVLDLGGGTGGTAVPLAAAGHDVTVVDPSPDALAALRRRAGESGVTSRVHAVQGDTDTVGRLGSPDQPRFDLVCLHGTLEVVDDPGAALENIAAVLDSSGVLSLVVAQRLHAVLAQALVGEFDRARAVLERPDGRWGDDDPSPRRYDEAAVLGMLQAHGFLPVDVHGVRVFTDLVPSALLDADSGRAGLLALEDAVVRHPDHPLGALGSALHVVAIRP